MNDKKVFRIVLGVSIVVFLLVVALNERILGPPTNYPTFIKKLPVFHAILNGSCAVLLLLSLKAIRAKKVALHKKLNLTAFGLSALFLMSYVTYHYFVPSTSYGGEGVLKSIYYVILVSHIILAALVLPLILMSFWFALKNNIERHKKWVRFSYPIWLYVTISGVIVFLMISKYYQ